MRFTPQSWTTAGSELSGAGASVKADVDAVIARTSDTGAIGCDSGLTLIDAALAGIVPAAMQALQQTVDGIAAGLVQEGQAFTATGRAYAELEQAMTEAAAAATATD